MKWVISAELTYEPAVIGPAKPSRISLTAAPMSGTRAAMTAISLGQEVPADLVGQPDVDRVPARTVHRLAD